MFTCGGIELQKIQCTFYRKCLVLATSCKALPREANSKAVVQTFAHVKAVERALMLHNFQAGTAASATCEPLPLPCVL